MKKSYIKCRWLDMNKILVNPDGQVYPCCYLANKAYKSEQLGVFGPNNQVEDMSQKGQNWYWKPGDELMHEYKKNYDDLNIKNKSMEEIVNHDWYTKTLPESWEKEETRFEACRTFCEHYKED
tara:strand:+ start:3146 stop:3514 length:369 start_codon:yes stop_codon:yes gene_type:complete